MPPSGYSARTPSCVQQQRVGETTPLALTEGTMAEQWLPKTALLHRNAVPWEPAQRSGLPQRNGSPRPRCFTCYNGGDLYSTVAPLVPYLFNCLLPPWVYPWELEVLDDGHHRALGCTAPKVFPLAVAGTIP